MKFNFRLSRTQSIKLALLALFGAGLACQQPGVGPDNPVVQQSIVVEGLTFTQYVEQLGVLPAQNIAPWIVQPNPESPPQGGGIISFGGWGPTQTDLKSNDIPTVALYEVLPNGCDKPLLLGRKLGTTSNSVTSNEWEMPNIQIPSDVAIVGAVLEYDGNQGPLGNLLILNSDRLKPVVSKPTQNKPVGFKTDFIGQAMPGLCLELWRGAQILGKGSADTDRNWKLSAVPIEPGENIIELRVWLIGEHTTYSAYENYNIAGPTLPQLVWPFGEMEGNIYMPHSAMNCITGWYGPNDFYIESGYGFHYGLDIGYLCENKTIKNDIVRSVAGGKVLKVREDSIHGKFILVDHGQWASVYLHLAKQNVIEEQSVKAGDELGIMGSTGRSTGKHLHLGAFWWPSDKEKAIGQIKLNEKTGMYSVTVGGIHINLNPQSNEQYFSNTNIDLRCLASSFDFWNIDWSTVYVVVTNQLGTAFTKTKCPENNP